MKKALRNSISILLMALAFALTQLPLDMVAADTATASSRADEFQMSGSTLVKYTGTAKTVSVPASVKEIGTEAFIDNTTMETLLLNKELETIDARAFSGCTSLKEVSIPDAVVEIGNGGFSNCTALSKVTLGNGLGSLGLGVFSGCNALKTMTVSKDNTSFVVTDDCLYNMDKTKLFLVLPGRTKASYTMPGTVTDIAEYAFWGNKRLNTVSLSSNLTQIPDYSFMNFTALQTISIPYSVKSIGIKSFSDCINLSLVNIPSSVTSIHESAFDGCSKLIIQADAGTVGADFYEKWKENDTGHVEYEDTGSSINDEETDSNGQDESPLPSEEPVQGDLLASTYVVGNRAFLFLDNSNGSVLVDTSGSGLHNDGASAELITDQNQVELDQTDISDGNIEEVAQTGKDISIPKFTIVSNEGIADLAFYQNSQITAYDIPSTVTTIGEFSFARSAIQSIIIPEGVTTIEYGAFYHCNSLRDVTIPSSVCTIESKAFSKTAWLDNWSDNSTGEDFLIVGRGILLAYKGTQSNVIIPDNVTKIGAEAFLNCQTIESVVLPDSIEEIEEAAFSGCNNLHSVTGGSNLIKIADRAFAGCPLDQTRIGDSVQFIGQHAIDFSNMNLSTSSKVVVFEGTNLLPQVSNEKTAQRLSNREQRGYSLNDVCIAIVDKSIKTNELTGTVLDPNGTGFHGVVAYIESRDRATVTCIASGMTKEELKSSYVPQYIMILGKTYYVNDISSIEVYRSEESSSLFQGTGEITISNSSKMLSTDSLGASIDYTSDTTNYELVITDSIEGDKRIQSAYQMVYEQELPQGAVVVDLSLIENSSGVVIDKLGNATMNFTLSLPSGNGAFRVVTVDEDGQLENVPYTRKGNRVTLSISHFSPFAFYYTSAANADRMDSSPDTGDITPLKWIGVIGLFAASIAVFLSGQRKKKHVKNSGI